jgi:hypothetical protein
VRHCQFSDVSQSLALTVVDLLGQAVALLPCTGANAQGWWLRRWPGRMDYRGDLRIDAKFVRVLLLERVLGGHEPPPHVRLFASLDAEVSDK